jgi:hypothetical protein
MRTFGYEAEFQTNAPQAYAALHERGMTPNRDMHRWHCDCSGCSYGSDNYPFRGQTDSSCSGEVISSINRIDGDTFDMAEAYIRTSDGNVSAREAFEAIQDAAVEYDAEPGTHSGFHVHVGVGHLDEEKKVKAVHNLCRWEELLYELAAGSLPQGLRSENTRYQQEHLISAQNQMDQAGSANIPYAEIRDGWVVDTRDGYRHREAPEPQELSVHLYQIAQRADRHSSLNLRTTHGTWEFRLWNSTRSAWRMEMFCGLSMAMVEPRIIEALDETPDDEITLDRFEEIIDVLPDLGELVRRQRALSVQTVPRFTQLVTA